MSACLTRFHLVRHGPTHAKCMVGWSDIPADLSDHAALRRLREGLPSNAVVVSSDLSRATATADAIAMGRTRLPNEPMLREIHFGAWEMRTWGEIDAESPALIRAFWETPGEVKAPNGESWNDVSQRVDLCMDRLAQEHAGREIIVVGHFGQILCQVQRACGLTASEAFAHKIDNLSVTRIEQRDGIWQAGTINQVL